MMNPTKIRPRSRIEVLARDIEPDGRCVIGRVEDLAGEDRWLIKAGSRTIGVFRVGDVFYALLNRCPHSGAELCRGDILPALVSKRPGEYIYDAGKPVIVCPWHAWEYDLATGESYVDPTGVRVKSYPVDIESDLKAETYPVEVDSDYVIVYLRGKPAR